MALSQLENSLNDVFVKKAPKLPENAVKWIVAYLPYINLILGVLSLLTAYWLWNGARVVSKFADLTNAFSQAVTGTKAVSSNFTIAVWIALVVMAIIAVLYILAFQGTKAKKKAGWNLMFYAMLLNVVYGLVNMFTYSGGASNFIGYLIGSAVGLYFLFQIRSSYN